MRQCRADISCQARRLSQRTVEDDDGCVGLHDHHDNQRAIYQLAGLDPDDPVHDVAFLIARLPVVIAVREGLVPAGRDAVLVRVPRLRAAPPPRRTADGALRPQRPKRRPRKPPNALEPTTDEDAARPPVFVIRLRRGLGRERRQRALAHEVAEWFLVHRVLQGEPDPEIERAADQLATVILCPWRAITEVVREILPEDLPAIAHLFSISEAHVVALIAERTGHPIAAVRPSEVLYGGDAFAFPSEKELRTLVENPLLGRSRHPHLCVDPASDERVAFVYPLEWPMADARHEAE